ncbi:hypothetical protein BEWA_050900 (apicoplast) [Theileria equi strain WA]|uniref:Ribosomal protein L6 n=1 Tax=Theileria equi strain WA TaxID=1537102 RepID=L1L973_THEEQ|nr:hypothetical protein BEWA_050900 [Theileria equi strain WA]EKX71957.1 hypothetical protein BEWA_050900 [Theileria equi strain WA]|eukprot:XP_025033550.1 hypothetical protein BEWA_050900 (apicoplast) [Theileria equi strain WA]
MNIKTFTTVIPAFLKIFDKKSKKLTLQNLNITTTTLNNTQTHSTKIKIKNTHPAFKTFNNTINKEPTTQTTLTTTLKIVKIYHKSYILNNHKIVIKLGHFKTTVINLPKNNKQTTATITQNGHLINIHTNNYKNLTQLTAIIKNIEKPNIYTGRGIYHINENIKLKEHKTY